MLSAPGRTIAAAYRTQIRAVPGQGVHGAFESACDAWAQQHDLRPEDGMYLSEIAAGPITIAELGVALAVCSQSRAAVAEHVERLVKAGLVVAVAAAG